MTENPLHGSHLVVEKGLANSMKPKQTHNQKYHN